MNSLDKIVISPEGATHFLSNLPTGKRVAIFLNLLLTNVSLQRFRIRMHCKQNFWNSFIPFFFFVIAGYLHKSGIKQLESYVEFAKRLEQEVDVAELSKDIPVCVLLVYDKMSSLAQQRFISAEEFLDVAKDYFERVKRVWNWQNENGPEARQAFRDCSVVKTHSSYRWVLLVMFLKLFESHFPD